MSELKQNETDVCCECGSTNLEYEELHTEVPFKEGQARLEQEVCYCCDCLAIQTEDAQAAGIERLTAKVEELEEDNARMREALQELYNLNLCPDYKTGASSENLFAEIARKALKGEG